MDHLAWLGRERIARIATEEIRHPRPSPGWTRFKMSGESACRLLMEVRGHGPARGWRKPVRARVSAPGARCGASALPAGEPAL
jgi:hypothetical protein